MKVFEVAAVIDCGEIYEVEYLTSSLNKDFEASPKFVGLSSYAAKLIKDALSEDKIVRIIKDYVNIDVMPNDLIIMNNVNDLDVQKTILIRKVRQLITHQQALVSGIMMYDFININNSLCDKGCYIHDDNKEEVYLKILETGEEDLISKLELYLNARDVISRSSYLEIEYNKFYQNMKTATSEEVDDLYSNFMVKLRNETK